MGVTALGLLLIVVVNCVIMTQKKSKVPSFLPSSLYSLICSGSFSGGSPLSPALGTALWVRQSWVWYTLFLGA